ncbi:MAG: LCP family protein [Acidobacteria bacterium]|nr:LCP family protein [Acidobacteriota bacterium]
MRGRLLALPALAVATALAWTALGSFSTGAGADEAPLVIDRAHHGSFQPDPAKPVFLLALGSDARHGNPTRARFDSIHIVAIDPAGKRATLVGIPRDSWVDIPGRGRNKINSAGVGGPDLMVRTVEALSGCRFDYYMITAFDGFQRMVEEFGGLPVDVPMRVHDKYANRIDLAPGLQTLDGREALGYARSRKGTPAFTPRGDFDRSLHQGDLMVAALRKARAQLAGDPGAILRYLAIVLRHVKSSLPLAEALRLGMLSARVDPQQVTNIVVDGGTGMVGGVSTVQISAKGLNQLADVCADGVLDAP